jgi:short-subunit dehydrogenase
MAAQLKPISEQVIVITGASSGIGLATALMAAKRGAKVVLAARSDETLADIVKKIQDDGGIAFAVCADVTVRADLEQIASQAISTFGRIDTWVNNAGVAIYGKLEDVPEADSRKLFDINFWGVVNGSLIALPYVKQSKGALINLGSEVSEAVVPLQGMYSASKHAVKGFTDALRVEVVDVDKQDVSITLIQPTAVDTPYPQHARNYMEHEPKLPGPTIEADKVAEAILEAAQKPRRDVKVGARAVVDTFMGKFGGRLSDKLAAKFADKQQYDEKPRDPEGTLEKPGQSGQVKGGGPKKSAA